MVGDVSCDAGDFSQTAAFIGVTKHRTGPKHRSFHDLFVQISNIFQQPAGMATSAFGN